MAQPLLPPHGIFIPTHMIFNTQLPSAVLVTWIQLRCLAWGGWYTPPMSISKLASLIGIHPARLYRHLSHLQEISALSWRMTKDGKLILAFPEEPSFMTENQTSAAILPGSPIPYSQDQETLATPSYFPPQILGYLCYQDEQEVLLNCEQFEDLENFVDLNNESARNMIS
jgi:hypothetical protein